MADNSSAFEILVRLKAEYAEATKARKEVTALGNEIAKVTEVAKKNGQETQHLITIQANLAREEAQAAAAERKLAEAYKEAQKAANGAAEAHKEQAKGIQRVAVGSQAIDTAIKAVEKTSPAAAAAVTKLILPIIAVSKAYEWASAKIKEWSASLDEAAKRAADPTFLASVLAKNEALMQGSVEAKKWADHLNDLESAENKHAHRLELSTGLINDQKTALQQAADDKLSLEKEQIAADVKSGKITPEQGAVKGAVADRTAAAEKTKADENARKAEIQANENERVAAVARLAKLTADEKEAAAKKTQADAAVKANAADFSKFKDVGPGQATKETQERMDAAERAMPKPVIDTFKSGIGLGLANLGEHAMHGAELAVTGGQSNRYREFESAKRDRDEEIRMAAQARQKQEPALVAANAAAATLATIHSEQDKAKEAARKAAQAVSDAKIKEGDDETPGAGAARKAHEKVLAQERLQKEKETLAGAGPGGAAIVNEVDQSNSIAKRFLTGGNTTSNVTYQEREEMRRVAIEGSGQKNLTDQGSAAWLRQQLPNDKNPSTDRETGLLEKLSAKQEQQKLGNASLYAQQLATAEAQIEATAAHEAAMRETAAKLKEMADLINQHTSQISQVRIQN